MLLFASPRCALPRPQSRKPRATAFPTLCMRIRLPFYFWLFLPLPPRSFPLLRADASGTQRAGSAGGPAPSSGAAFGFHSPSGLKFLFPVLSQPREGRDPLAPRLLSRCQGRVLRHRDRDRDREWDRCRRRRRCGAGLAMTAEEKRSLQCYRRYIERSLNPVYILSNMTEWLSDGEGPAAPTSFPPPAGTGGVASPAPPPLLAPSLTLCLLRVFARGEGESEEGRGEGGDGGRRAVSGCHPAAGSGGMAAGLHRRPGRSRWVPTRK